MAWLEVLPLPAASQIVVPFERVRHGDLERDQVAVRPRAVDRQRALGDRVVDRLRAPREVDHAARVHGVAVVPARAQRHDPGLEARAGDADAVVRARARHARAERAVADEIRGIVVGRAQVLARRAETAATKSQPR